VRPGTVCERDGEELSIQVIVNGDPRDLPEGATVTTAIELLHGAPGGRGVAVAVGGEVIPRGRWDSTQLHEGERVEVVVAVQGG
jgi:sulfur carrier protein